MAIIGACRDCGSPFEVRALSRHRHLFCSKDCLTAWRNRRAQRGAIVYDFLMSKRYDRINETEARRVVDNLCRAFRDADSALRGGRPSWRPFDEAIKDLPLAYSTSGDNR